MLELQFSDIAYQKNLFYPSQNVVLYYHQPLLIKGPGEQRRAFFQELAHLKNWQITQAGQILKNKEILPYIIELTPELHINSKLKIAKLCKRYTSLPEAKWHTILPSYMDLHMKLSSYSLDDQWLVQTILLLQQTSFILCIRGDWNLCSESLKNKVRELLSQSMDHHAYFLVEEGAEEILPCTEVWDMEEPPSMPVTNFLEEDPDITGLIKQHPSIKQSTQIFTWKRTISGVLYMVFASIFITFCIHLFLQYYDDIQAYERALVVDEDHQIPVYVAGKHPDEYWQENDLTGPAYPLSEDQLQLLQDIIGTYPLYSMNEAQISMTIESSDSEGMNIQTILRTIKTIPKEVQPMLCDTCDLEGEGIYITERMAEEHGLDEGQSLNTTIEIPMRYYYDEMNSMAQYVNKNNSLTYIPLYESYEVSLPIKKVINTISPFTTYTPIHNTEILMDESLYDSIQKQILAQGALFQKGNVPENLSQEVYNLSESEELVPYTPASYLLLVSSKEEAEQIHKVLKTQREVKVWTDNPYDSLTEIAGALQETRTMSVEYLSKYCWILAGIFIAALALYLHMIKKTQSFQLFHNRKPSHKLHFSLLFIGMLSFTAILSRIKWFEVFIRLSSKLPFETMSMEKLKLYNVFLSYLDSFSFDKLVILCSCISVIIASVLPYLAISCKLLPHRSHKNK